MATLFAKKKKKVKPSPTAAVPSGKKRPRCQVDIGVDAGEPRNGCTPDKRLKPARTTVDAVGVGAATASAIRKREMEEVHVDQQAVSDSMRDEGNAGAKPTFGSLGLCDWLLTSCKAMGFRRPTPVQTHCIPAILEGKDVLGCAETGSGKTAAFALPILHELSKDPYGVFAVVLTPTRELAVQISEQFGALGALMGLRHAVVIGGVGLLEQSVELSGRPHVVVATPGRLRDHLQGPDKPALRKCRYLVLDEADRLLAPTFQAELRCITQALPETRQTLLFSATMTSNLEELEALALTNPVKYDLTKKATVPATLTQEYLFMPQQMKTCFVVQALRKLASENLWSDPEERHSRQRNKAGQGGGKGMASKAGADDGFSGVEDEERDGDGGKVRSAMIFVSKCRRCHELSETLLELGLDCTPLHSLLGQRRRVAALGKFKSQQTKVLVSTDVASRGLDIPAVDLVINYDVPRVATDYVHRVGRTARAGRRGRAVSLVSQYDIELVHNIEQYTGSPLSLCPDVKEDDVLKLLNQVAKASRVAKMRLMEQGFDERESAIKDRNNRQKEAKLSLNGTGAGALSPTRRSKTTKVRRGNGHKVSSDRKKSERDGSIAGKTAPQQLRKER